MSLDGLRDWEPEVIRLLDLARLEIEKKQRNEKRVDRPTRQAVEHVLKTVLATLSAVDELESAQATLQGTVEALVRARTPNPRRF